MNHITLAIASSLIVIILAVLFTVIKKLKETKTSLKESIIKNNEYKNKFTEYFNTEEECNLLIKKTEKERDEIETEAANRLSAMNQEVESVLSIKNNLVKEIENIRNSYTQKKKTYDQLIRQIAIFSEEIELAELGFYQPHFNFDDSEKFKDQIKDIREKQKDMLREKTKYGAVFCTTEWTVSGSRAEGKKMADRAIRLTARAFNNECDAAIANCTWKNITKMKERIEKAFEAINKLNETNLVEINRSYFRLKLQELYLTHEYRDKKQKEKEEQAEIRAQMRDEERAQREIERAMQEAEAEERRYQKAIDAARKEMEKTTGEMRSRLEERITALEQDLADAESKHQRALSMAQQTRQGHVYIISNIGSFGENVYKIGMTRRLDPQDRVDELGDASVPFIFDIHAMIHSADAPALEKKLHDLFEKKRVNMINRRKEFFQVSLDEIKTAVTMFSDEDVDFIETAVAKDFYETKAIREHEIIQSGIATSDKAVSSNVPEFADAI